MYKRFFLLLISLLSFTGSLSQNLDIDILRQLNKPYEHGLSFWLDMTSSAYWIPPTYVASNIAYGVVAHDKKARRYALEALIGLVASTAVTHAIKPIVNRPRPAEAYPGIIRTYSYSNGQSFPSGHSSLAFATATTMAYQGQRWYLTAPAALWASTIGYSRMRLGKHYPSDVLTGAAIGVGSGIFSHWLTQKIVHKRRRSR